MLDFISLLSVLFYLFFFEFSSFFKGGFTTHCNLLIHALFVLEDMLAKLAGVEDPAWDNGEVVDPPDPAELCQVRLQLIRIRLVSIACVCTATILRKLCFYKY